MCSKSGPTEMTRAKWMTDEQWRETRHARRRRDYKHNKEKRIQINFYRILANRQQKQPL